MRSEIADHLRTNLPDLFDEFTIAVYDAGEDVIAVPAVVIFPSNPYLSIATMGSEPGSKRINVALELNLVANRNEPDEALAQLEEMRFLVTEALRGFKPTVAWATFGNFATTDIGGVEYATASIDTITLDVDRGSS